MFWPEGLPELFYKNAALKKIREIVKKAPTLWVSFLIKSQALDSSKRQLLSNTETHSEPTQTSKVELF